MYRMTAKVKSLKPWQLLSITVALSGLLIFFAHAIERYLLRGLISTHLLAVGAIDAVVFSLIVSAVVIYFWHEKRQIEKKSLFSQFAIDHAVDGITLADSDARIRYVNDTICCALGYSQDELLSMTIHDIDPNFPKDRWPAHWEELKKRKFHLIETVHRTKDGRNLPVEVAINYQVFGGHEYHCAFVRDISERKQAEETLQRSHAELDRRVRERTKELAHSEERLRNLYSHLQTMREEERMNIAREIHDDLGQSLTALKMDLSSIAKKLPDDSEGLRARLKANVDEVGKTIQAVKRVCTELRPGILDSFGLAAALEWQAGEFQRRTGIKCAVVLHPKDIEVDADLRTPLFRIFQEALTNVLRHAKATEVMVSFKRIDKSVVLEIEDNGIGIKEEEVSNPGSLGLLGMQERVYPLQGKVTVRGVKNKGTIVGVTIPIMALDAS